MAETYMVGHPEERVEGYDTVSPGSPLGSALIGEPVGSWVSYAAPNGELKAKILAAVPAT
jgi:transcription elongation GreA/GreB family factor